MFLRGGEPGSRLILSVVGLHTIHMKRTNLVLDGDLLETATRVLGVKTYSAAVNEALAEVIRIRRIQGLRQYFGQGLWEGDLSQMREDSPPPGKTVPPRKGRRR